MKATSTIKESPLDILYKLQPRRIFLLDALGALTTASILGLVLPLFNNLFLLEDHIFYLLSAYVVILFFYSSSVYIFQPSSWVPHLRVIASANAAYCIFTIAIIMFKSEVVSIYTIIYFTGEAILIFFIAFIEWKYADKNKKLQFSSYDSNYKE